MQSVSSSNIAQSLSKMASPGDWPWHVALFRGDIHVCDGTLVSSKWVLTTDSCFQGQPKATWLAIFGAVRLTAHAPWKQRRRIVGMVKSPVEGSTAALIRLETPVDVSDFIRPICLPDEIDRDEFTFQSLPHHIPDNSNRLTPEASRLESSSLINNQHIPVPSKRSNIIRENTEYFQTPVTRYLGGLFDLPESHEFSAEFSDEGEHYPRAEALKSSMNYPLPNNSPQTLHYEQQKEATKDGNLGSYVVPSPLSLNYALSDVNAKQHHWTQCNTLGWSRQRDHLQRVQIKIGDMAACENVSIATVNSMCAEAAFHKPDCNVN